MKSLFLTLMLLFFGAQAMAAEYIPPDNRSTEWSAPSHSNEWFGAGARGPKTAPRVMPTMPAVPDIIAPLPVPRPHVVVRHHRHHRIHHHRHHRHGHWICHWVPW